MPVHSTPVTQDRQPIAHDEILRGPAELGRLVLIASTIAAALLVLVASWRVHEFGIPLESICMALPLGLVGGATWLLGALLTIRGQGADRGRNVRWMIAAAVLALTALGLAKTSVIPRAYFRMHQGAFETEVALLQASSPAPPHGADYVRIDLDKRLGGYSVDVVGLDASGGLWFRTATFSDWIDRGSEGFYYRPPGVVPPRNRYGDLTTPFGAAKLHLRRLGGGWHWFSVTDDYY